MGQKTATCQYRKTWSAGVPTCVGKTVCVVILCVILFHKTPGPPKHMLHVIICLWFNVSCSPQCTPHNIRLLYIIDVWNKKSKPLDLCM